MTFQQYNAKQNTSTWNQRIIDTWYFIKKTNLFSTEAESVREVSSSHASLCFWHMQVEGQERPH